MINQRFTYLPVRLGAMILTLMQSFQFGFGQTATIVRLGNLGGSQTTASAVNSIGQVVGNSYTLGDAEQRPFLFVDEQMRDLGSLGGSFGSALAINDSGVIVGFSAISWNMGMQAFVVRNGIFSRLEALGGGFSMAVAVNSAGQIVGESTTADGGATHAFLYSQGDITDLGTLGGTLSSPYAINANGWVVGESTIAGDWEYHAFLWHDGQIQDLGTLGGQSSLAVDLNQAGWVVGYSTLFGDEETHAFLYDGTRMLDLETLGGGYSDALKINVMGVIIGDSELANSDLHGYCIRAVGMEDLGTLGGSFSSVHDLNSAAMIIGESTISGGAKHAFLWEDGIMIDLNRLLPPNSDWELVCANYISEGGHIVGYGYYQGVLEWYLLSLNRVSNQAPIADAGPDQVVECLGEYTPIELSGTGSSDSDGDELEYQWYWESTLMGTGPVLPVMVGSGLTTITLKVSDPTGAWDEDFVTVSVTDTTPPQIKCPPPAVISADETGTGVVPDLLGVFAADDSCSSPGALNKTQLPAAGSRLNAGTHLIELAATDTAGNTSICTVDLVIKDVTPPVISELRADPELLTTTDGRMVTVELSASVVDNCDPAPRCQIVSIDMSEPETSKKDTTAPDWTITDSLTAQLRAETTNKFIDRVYTLTVRCSDATGNVAESKVVVVVESEKEKKVNRSNKSSPKS